MNRSELEMKIKALGIPTYLYSLEGKLIYGVVLERSSYSNWRVFRFDQRGNYDSEQKFDIEGSACDYAYQLLLQTAKLLPGEVRDKYRSIYFNGNPPE